MVEANPAAEEGYDMDEQNMKTFIDEPAILDKYKAAALITDSKFRRPLVSVQFLTRVF